MVVISELRAAGANRIRILSNNTVLSKDDLPYGMALMNMLQLQKGKERFSDCRKLYTFKIKTCFYRSHEIK